MISKKSVQEAWNSPRTVTEVYASWSCCSATRAPSRRKTSSTRSPVFADVMKNSAWYAFANAATSISRNRVRGEVCFVHRDQDRNLSHHVLDAVDPVVEVVERPSSREVGYREDAIRPVEVRVLQQLAKSLLAHDVPDHHVDVDQEIVFRQENAGLLLRHVRADRGQVSLVEHVDRVPADQRGLADGLVPDETHLRLEPLLLRHPTSSPGTAARLRRWLLNDSRAVLSVDSRRDRDTLPLEDHGPEATEEDLHVIARLRRGVVIGR